MSFEPKSEFVTADEHDAAYAIYTSGTTGNPKGDLARVDENGNYVLLGRSNDMIKINGNRIEPAEIEALIKQVLGVDWAAARRYFVFRQIIIDNPAHYAII